LSSSDSAQGQPTPLRGDIFDEADGTWERGGRGGWVPMLLGLLLIGLGVWMLANLVESVLVLAVIIGVTLITSGVVNALTGGSRPGPRWAAWIEGLLLVGVGVVVLAWPDITLWVLAVAGGLTLLLGGLLHMAIGFMGRHEDPGWTLDLGLGALGVVLGSVVLLWPGATLVVLAVLFGVRSIIVGAVAVWAGWHLRGATP